MNPLDKISRGTTVVEQVFKDKKVMLHQAQKLLLLCQRLSTYDKPKKKKKNLLTYYFGDPTPKKAFSSFLFLFFLIVLSPNKQLVKRIQTYD